MRQLAESAERQKLKAIGHRIQIQLDNLKDSIQGEEKMMTDENEVKEKQVVQTNKSHAVSTMKTVGGHGRQRAKNDDRG